MLLVKNTVALLLLRVQMALPSINFSKPALNLSFGPLLTE